MKFVRFLAQGQEGIGVLTEDGRSVVPQEGFCL